MDQPKKLLFICSRNQLRSLTAERMYQGVPDYAVKSAGTSPAARVRVNEGHIGWADIIFVMEKKHARILRERFGEDLDGKRVICLNIPDDYRYMEPELIEEVKAKLSEYGAAPDRTKPAGNGLTQPKMKKSNKNSPPLLTKGQLWKTDNGYIQIWDIGKRLINYKMMGAPGQKGVRTQATGIGTLQTYLKDNAAVLVS